MSNQIIWNLAWDPSLSKLVTECYFDFNIIAGRMNQQFKTNIFTEQTCQARWGEIHKQRKAQAQKKEPEKVTTNPPPSNLDSFEKIQKASRNLYEDPKKSMTLKELTSSLPSQRKTRDFLDPSATEIDKDFDMT